MLLNLPLFYTIEPWSDWSPWETCTKSCGHGKKHRSRRCNAIPGVDGKYEICEVGKTESETQLCDMGPCGKYHHEVEDRHHSNNRNIEHRRIDRNDSPGDDGWGRFDGWREGKIDHNSEKNENDSTEKDDQTEPKQVNDFPPTGAVKVEPDFEKDFSKKESLDDYPDYEEEGIEEELPQYSSIEEEIEFEEV